MRIGILGSRGIPNRYGGFEELAEQLGTRLVKKGHEVSVYCPHHHPVQAAEYQGIKRILCYDPEPGIGTVGQFIYDFNCWVDSRKRKFDVLLQLGYTSSSIWHFLAPSGTAVVTNMDGLEWKRSKYGPAVRRFLRFAERLAVDHSSSLVADSEVIRDYLSETYLAPAAFIAYGAEPFKDPDPLVLEKYGVLPGGYHLIIARMEKENNLGMMLEGVTLSQSARPTLVIGNQETPHARQLQKKFKDPRIRFVRALYNKSDLNNLRHFSAWYLHGHSAGGTNPSLLEAMACQAPVAAHNNPFNREVLRTAALYFSDPQEVAEILDLDESREDRNQRIQEGLKRIKGDYNWELITDLYEMSFDHARVNA